MLCKDRTDDLEDVKIEIRKFISHIGSDLFVFVCRIDK